MIAPPFRSSQTKYEFLDHLLNFFLITPLVVVYAYTAEGLVDIWFKERTELRALILLSSAIIIEIVLALLRDRQSGPFRINESPFLYLLLLNSFNYFRAFANILHYKGLEELFEFRQAAAFNISSNGSSVDAIHNTPATPLHASSVAEEDPATIAIWNSSVQLLVTASIFLMSLRCNRNILSCPMAISLNFECEDSEFNRELTGTTYFRTRGGFMNLLDHWITVAAIYSIVHLHWIGTWTALDILIYPHQHSMSSLSCTALGYFICYVFLTSQYYVAKQTLKLQKSNLLLAFLLENLIVTVANAGSILVWIGYWKAFDRLIADFPLFQGDPLSSQLFWHISSYLLLSMAHVTNTLVFDGCELDREIPTGAELNKRPRPFFSVGYLSVMMGATYSSLRGEYFPLESLKNGTEEAVIPVRKAEQKRGREKERRVSVTLYTTATSSTTTAGAKTVKTGEAGPRSRHHSAKTAGSKRPVSLSSSNLKAQTKLGPSLQSLVSSAQTKQSKKQT